MSEPIFKVTESFIPGERYVEVLRPLSEQDFDFEEIPYENHDGADDKSPHVWAPYPICVGMTVKGIMRPDILAEIKTALPIDDRNPNFDDFDYCLARHKLLSNGSIRKSEFEKQECRSGYDLKRIMLVMREQVAAKIPILRSEIVELANDLISRIAQTTNSSYTKSAIRPLIQEWDGIHEEAGTAADRDEGLRLIREGRAKLFSVRERLNDWMLRKMDKEGWKVNDKPLCETVVHEIAETYRNYAAFQDVISGYCEVDADEIGLLRRAAMRVDRMADDAEEKDCAVKIAEHGNTLSDLKDISDL